MNLIEFLTARGLDGQNVVSAVRAVTGLLDDDLLLATGSLVEGIGNSTSDLDLLLITNRDLRSHPREIAISLGGSILDIELLEHEEVNRLVNQAQSWFGMPWDLARSSGLHLQERRLLHRLRHCFPLHGQRLALEVNQLVSMECLSKLKLHASRQMARSVQVDMAGLYDAGDYVSLTLAAQNLLLLAVDALTALYSLTNPVPKWRMRLLQRIPGSWRSQLGVFCAEANVTFYVWNLHRAPERPDCSSALKHAARISTFARAIFLEAELRILAGDVLTTEREALPNFCGTPQIQHYASTYLRLDVEVIGDSGAFYAARLNGSEAPVRLSHEETRTMLSVDGLTGTGEDDLSSRLESAGLLLRV